MLVKNYKKNCQTVRPLDIIEISSAFNILIFIKEMK